MIEGPSRLSGQVLSRMHARGWGCVVGVSAVHGLRASQFKAAHVAARHGLEGLSKVIALEGAAHGVTSSSIHPACARTPLVESQVEALAVGHGIESVQVLGENSPTVVKQPERGAELAAYLCSSITGFSLWWMEGGRHAY